MRQQQLQNLIRSARKHMDLLRKAGYEPHSLRDQALLDQINVLERDAVTRQQHN